MKSRVWVCTRGANYEGESVEAVMGSFAKALEWLAAQRVMSERQMEGMREHTRTWRAAERQPSEEKINQWRTLPTVVDEEEQSAECEDTSGRSSVIPWDVQ